jgi:flavin reductase (DIM6/NTAB) family NADH-FMN oxidoreductase RutF
MPCRVCAASGWAAVWIRWITSWIWVWSPADGGGPALVPAHERRLAGRPEPRQRGRRGMTATDPRTVPWPETGVPATEFRHAIGHFATGVTVVTSVGPDGDPVGTTANAVSSLSLDPPLILVCFDRASQTPAGGAHPRRVRGERARRAAAAPVGQLRAPWAGRRLGRGAAPPRPDRQPAAGRVIASLECTVEHRLDGGDHDIIVGRVQDVETSRSDTPPLLFWRGGYASLSGA